MIVAMLRSSTAIMGMKTFHCQRMPVAQRTNCGSFIPVLHQRGVRDASRSGESRIEEMRKERAVESVRRSGVEWAHARITTTGNSWIGSGTNLSILDGIARTVDEGA